MTVNQFDGSFNGRVFVPSNIKNNKQMILGKCDLRNIIYIFIGGVIFAFFFFIFKASDNLSIGIMLGLIFGTPFFIISFIKIKGLNFEELLLIFRANKLSSNTVRINNLDNVYETLIKKKNIVVIDPKEKKKKKSILGMFVHKKEKNINIVDTDDNIIKIQNIELKSKKEKKKEKEKVSSLIYN